MEALCHPYMYDKNILLHHVVFTATTLERLHTDLLTGYKRVRPVLNWTETVDVNVLFYLYQVKSLVCKIYFSLCLSQYQYAMSFIITNDAA